MPLPAPSWGNYHFFPLAFEGSGAGRGYTTKHLQNDFADRFIARQENGLWRFNLGGMKILNSYITKWDAFVDATQGQAEAVLFRLNSARFELKQDQTGYDGEPCGIGIGDGVETEFQLRKARSYAYGPENLSWENIRFPWHNYPTMKAPSGNGEGTTIYNTEYVRVWVDGDELTWLDGWDIDRETGIITFDDPPADEALIQASCKFFVAVHGQDIYLPENMGSHWEFPAGAELFQVASER